MDRSASPINLLFILVLSTATLCSSLASGSSAESESWEHGRSLLQSSRRQLLGHETSLSSEHPPGIRAELFHRDHELRTPGGLSHKERAERDVKFSRMRAEDLHTRGGSRSGSKRRLTENFRAKVTNAPGEYVMSLSIGTPAQNFVAVIDTGSDLTWLQCSSCQDCFNQVNEPFRAPNSSTYSSLTCADKFCDLFLDEYNDDWVTSCNLQANADAQRVGCKYAYFYADTSNTTGDFVSDTVNLQTLSGSISRIPKFAFGCSRTSYSPTSLFEGSDGLVGLAQGGISFPAQIGSVYGDVFSYCLVNSDDSRSKSSSIYFGAEASVFNVSGLQYTPLLTDTTDPTFYFVSLEGMSVDGKQVDISKDWLAVDSKGKGGVFFDSGTTLTIVEPRALDALTKVLVAKMNYTLQQPSPVEGLDYCWDVRRSFFSDIKAPSISFNFTNANYELGFENAYLLVGDRGFLSLCLAMTPASQPGGTTIIGNIQQRNFHVVYDRVKNRIGFAKKDCSSAPILSLHTFAFVFIQIVAFVAIHASR